MRRHTPGFSEIAEKDAVPAALIGGRAQSHPVRGEEVSESRCVAYLVADTTHSGPNFRFVAVEWGDPCHELFARLLARTLIFYPNCCFYLHSLAGLRARGVPEARLQGVWPSLAV